MYYTLNFNSYRRLSFARGSVHMYIGCHDIKQSLSFLKNQNIFMLCNEILL